MAGFIGSFSFNFKCKDSPNSTSFYVVGDFPYPFDDVTITTTSPCENMTTEGLTRLSEKVDYRSDAQYFVFTGVTSMLFVLVATGYYVFFEDRARDATSTDVGLLSFPVVVRLLYFMRGSSEIYSQDFQNMLVAERQNKVHFEVIKPTLIHNNFCFVLTLVFNDYLWETSKMDNQATVS